MYNLKSKIMTLTSLVLLTFPIWSMDSDHITKVSESLTTRKDFLLLHSLKSMGLPNDLIDFIGRLMLSNALDYTNLKYTILNSHTESIKSGCFSPDSKTILTYSNDKTALLWDTKSGDCIHILNDHTNVVFSGCFSSDGKTILTCPWNTRARLWDTNGNYLHTLNGHTARISSGYFSPDDKTILTCSEDNTARLWDTKSCDCIHTLNDQTYGVYLGCFSPDGKTILTLSNDNIARLWNAKSGNLIYKLKEDHSWISSGCFSPDGKTILTCSTSARLWDTESGNCIYTLISHSPHSISGCFSPDGKTILACSDTESHLWDTKSGKCIYSLEGHKNWIDLECFSPDGKTILTYSFDGLARLWRRTPCEASRFLLEHSTFLQACFILRAEEAFRAGTPWKISLHTYDWDIFQSFPDVVKTYIEKWFSVIVDKFVPTNSIENKIGTEEESKEYLSDRCVIQ